MGKSRTAEAGAGDPPGVLSGSDIEEADIEALARSVLKPGETILGEGKQDKQDIESRGVCHAPMLLNKVQEIEYKVPEGAKRVPWIDTLTIGGQKDFPKGISAKDGVKLEAEFLNVAVEAVKEGYRRLRLMKVPCARPSDFYAEMLKTDKQMYLIRQRAAEETRRIKIVEERRKAQAAKKFAKKARGKKLQARAEEKRKSLQDISKWRESKKGEHKEDDRDLEDILDKQQQSKGKKKLPMKSKKRELADKKFGFGGKKRFKKQNDSRSVDDLPWERKSKGKGKGKGRGKGKARGLSKGRAQGGSGKKRKRS